MTTTPAFHGVPLAPGTAALHRAVEEIWWYDRSPFISAPCVQILPKLRYEHRPFHDHRATMPAARQEDRVADTRRIGVAFAPEHGRGAITWAIRNRLRLAAPIREAVDIAADKIRSAALFERAGVRIPEYFVIPATDRENPARYWAQAGRSPVVVQRRQNNLLGRGTRLAGSADELGACLADWAGEELKASTYLPGVPLTVSGCAGPDRTVVSGVSHQLVGVPGLVDAWGAHCGNQLLTPSQLAPPLLASCRDACERTGEALRAIGFRGAFGLDLVGDGDHAIAIEINPRFQTVVGLVHVAEVAAGILPMLGVHVLSFVTDALPDARPVLAPAVALSQVVAHAPHGGHLRVVVPEGCHRLADGRLVPVEPRPLGSLNDDEALIWQHAQPGARVEAGDEVALIQFSGHVADLSSRPALSGRARAWLAVVDALTWIES